MSRDLRSSEVTRNWSHLTGSHLEVAVEGRKLTYTVRLTSYKAVACRRRQSRDRKWRHVTACDRKWRHLTGSHLEVAVERQKLAYTVRLTSYKAVTRRKRHSRDTKSRHDLRWPEVTRKWRHLSGSHLEVAVEGRKLTYTMRLTSYKAVARRQEAVTWQEMSHMTFNEHKWPGSDVIWPEVTWKWL